MVIAQRLVALVFFMLAVVATAEFPAEASTGWNGDVVLEVSRDQVDVHSPYATLTATTTSQVEAPYSISLYDADTNARVKSCWETTTHKPTRCWTSISVPVNATRSFVAYVAQDRPDAGPPVNDVRAVSTAVTVTNTGWNGAVALEVSRDQVDVHSPYATLTATATSQMRVPYRITLYDADTSALIKSCGETSTYKPSSCSTSISVPNNATRSFVAYVAQDYPSTGPPVNDVRAVSTAVTVTNTGWNGAVAVEVSRDQVDVHSPYATLTATATSQMRVPYRITLYDADTHARIKSCGETSTYKPTSCSTTISVPVNATRSFIAYVSQDYPTTGPPVNDVRAVSNIVTVTHTGWNGDVALEVSRSQDSTVGTLTATTTAPLRSPYIVSIYDADTHQRLAYCRGDTSSEPRTCSAASGSLTGPRTFAAYVAQDSPSTGLPSNDVRAENVLPVSGILSDADLSVNDAAYIIPGFFAGVTAAQVCDQVLLVKGTHFQGTTTSDQYNSCATAATSSGRAMEAARAAMQACGRNPECVRRIIDAVVVIGGVEALDHYEAPDGKLKVVWPPDPPEEEYPPEPEPEPDAAGSMIPPRDGRGSCLDQAGKDTLLEAVHTHHIATWYENAGWPTEFRRVLENNGLGHMTDLKNADWNLIDIPHRGPHPDAYHEWVRDNLTSAATQADERVEVEMPTATEDIKTHTREKYFRQLWQYVRWVVWHDPAIVRKAWWDCL